MRHASCPLRAALLVWLALAAAGCGKKGPPLPPFSRAPAAPAELTARRQGNTVVVGFVVPDSNTDGRTPARIDRVEVHALSAESAPVAVIEEHALVVATVPVRPPPPPPPDVEEGKPPPPPPPPPSGPGLDQGARAQVVDELSDDELVLTTIPELEEARAEAEESARRKAEELEPPKLSPPDLGPPLPEPPRRFYAARGRNGGRKGAWSERVAVPLGPAPAPPSAPEIRVEEGRLVLAWTPPDPVRRPPQKPTMAAPAPAVPGIAPPGAASPGAQPAPPPAPLPEPAPPSPAPPAEPPAGGPAPLEAPGAGPAGTAAPQDQAAESGAAASAPRLPSRLLTPWRVTTTSYAVDEVAPPKAERPVLEPGQVPRFPARLTRAPVPAPAWTLSGINYGIERCFVVRTVETTGALVIESEPSPPTCVTPADTFPPAPPTRLAAVASEGAIGLIWEASPASDVAGYIVLRGEEGEQLRPLTPKPVAETTYRDTTVEPGIRYVYAVRAVDGAKPPNVSAESNRVEETAR